MNKSIQDQIIDLLNRIQDEQEFRANLGDYHYALIDGLVRRSKINARLGFRTQVNIVEKEAIRHAIELKPELNHRLGGFLEA